MIKKLLISLAAIFTVGINFSYNKETVKIQYIEITEGDILQFQVEEGNK